MSTPKIATLSREYLVDIPMARIAFTSIPDMSTSLDPREVPQYSLAELAYYIDIPKPTLHAWSRPTKLNNREIPPLITPADRDSALYSFYNLIEAHLLSMTTRVHGVSTVNVRRAMQHLRDKSLHELPHPLLSEKFFTDGRGIWISELEKRIDLSSYGQMGLAPVLDTYLERIIRDESFRPKKLFPMQQHGRIVSITPSISSGRPIIEGTGIPVATVWNRFKAGDSVDYLAEDFEISEDQIKGALSYIEHLSTAA